jgi:hypothetical protein
MTASAAANSSVPLSMARRACPTKKSWSSAPLTSSATTRDGEIVEEAPPKDFFTRPQHPRARAFLGEILAHH